MHSCYKYYTSHEFWGKILSTNFLFDFNDIFIITTYITPALTPIMSASNYYAGNMRFKEM